MARFSAYMTLLRRASLVAFVLEVAVVHVRTTGLRISGSTLSSPLTVVLRDLAIRVTLVVVNFSPDGSNNRVSVSGDLCLQCRRMVHSGVEILPFFRKSTMSVRRQDIRATPASVPGYSPWRKRVSCNKTHSTSGVLYPTFRQVPPLPSGIAPCPKPRTITCRCSFLFLFGGGGGFENSLCHRRSIEPDKATHKWKVARHSGHPFGERCRMIERSETTGKPGTGNGPPRWGFSGIQSRFDRLEPPDREIRCPMARTASKQASAGFCARTGCAVLRRSFSAASPIHPRFDPPDGWGRTNFRKTLANPAWESTIFGG